MSWKEGSSSVVVSSLWEANFPGSCLLMICDSCQTQKLSSPIATGEGGLHKLPPEQGLPALGRASPRDRRAALSPENVMSSPLELPKSTAATANAHSVIQTLVWYGQDRASSSHPFFALLHPVEFRSPQSCVSLRTWSTLM